MSQIQKLSPKNLELIDKSVSNLKKGIKLLKETNILSKLKKVTGTPLPSMTDKELLDAWDNLKIDEKKMFDKFLSLLSNRNKMNIIKYIAKTDLSFKEGFMIGGARSSLLRRLKRSDADDEELVQYDDDIIEEVPRDNKKVFFYAHFIGSLMSLILGIVLLYLVAENIQGFNDEYELSITIKDLMTDFKGTVEYIPIAILGAVTREARDIMRNKIIQGCGSVSGNSITSFLYSLIESTDTSNCMQEQTVAGITEVAKLNAAKITTALKMSWRLSGAGITFITASTTNIVRLLLDKETPLAITNDGINDEIMEFDEINGGKKKSKRRKSKKSRKSKKGKKGRKSRRKH